MERTFADISRSREELGYQPTTRMAVGLAQFAEWFKANIHLYRLPGEPAVDVSFGPGVRPAVKAA
ncbi:MAG: hypothetical protein QM767_28040 [Anaeromyxobacter sp.]